MKKKKSRTRMGVQIIFFVFIALVSVNHSLIEAGKTGIPLLSSASLHALCPFGGVVSIYQVLVSGTFVKKIHESAFVLMGIGFILALLFGPVFCGWVCPFGSFQEALGKAGKKIFGRKYNHFIPGKIDNWLRYLRYIVLVWVIYVTAVSGKIFFADYDPYYVLFNFWTGEAALSGIIILVLVILASLFVERPFCKYACPYGAVQGVFNLFRIFAIKRNPITCISCGACDKACPMNIVVSTAGTIRNHQCISCYQCTSEQTCPVVQTVSMMTGTYPAAEGDKK